MTTHCFVRVLDKNSDSIYDVGPFSHSGNEAFCKSESAINWIYKQIGIIKTQYPDSSLIKHNWSYIKDDFFGPKADVKVEIQNIVFETYNLLSPDTHNVINEQTTDEYPAWVKTETDRPAENT